MVFIQFGSQLEHYFAADGCAVYSMCHAVQGTFVLLPVDEAGLGFCLGGGGYFH